MAGAAGAAARRREGRPARRALLRDGGKAQGGRCRETWRPFLLLFCLRMLLLHLKLRQPLLQRGRPWETPPPMVTASSRRPQRVRRNTDPMPQFDPQEMNRWSIDLQFGGEQKQLWSAGGGSGGSSFAKIARAVPKAESLEDASVGAQKFRVKLEPGPTDMLCQVLDSTIWCKTSVDVDAERIRLKSNSYTTNNMLDTVIAATIQIL